MIFNALVTTCFHQKTSFEESRSKVSIQPKNDEKVLFFVIDEGSNRESKIRDEYDLDGDICDLIIFYSKTGTGSGNQSKKVICFTELKGGDVEKAARQIVNTYNKLHGKFERKYLTDVVWKAAIRQTHCSHQDSKEANRLLLNCFGRSNYIKLERDDIGEFLRR